MDDGLPLSLILHVYYVSLVSPFQSLKLISMFTNYFLTSAADYMRRSPSAYLNINSSHFPRTFPFSTFVIFFVSSPTLNDINALQAIYIEHLKALFNKYKAEAGYPLLTLEIE